MAINCKSQYIKIINIFYLLRYDKEEKDIILKNNKKIEKLFLFLNLIIKII